MEPLTTERQPEVLLPSIAKIQLRPRRMKSVLQRKVRKRSSASRVDSNSDIIENERPLYNKDGDIAPPVPPKSPELIVRRRSLHSRSRSSNPVRRFFRRFLRLRGIGRKMKKLNYKYSKGQLTKQLSFDTPGYQDWSNTNFVNYTTNNADMIRLHPRMKRNSLVVDSSSLNMKPDSLENIRLYASLLHRPNPIRSSAASQTSTGLAKHKKPDRELPAAIRTQKSSLSVSDRKTNSRSPSLILAPENLHLSRASSRKPSSRRAREKEDRHLSKQNSVRRSATRSSRRSGISFKDRENVSDVEQSPILLSREASKKTTRSDVFDDEKTLDSALSFVSTWSRYLQQAIAVRVKLQQEIHQWEIQEEMEWRNSFQSSSDSDSFDRASSISLNSMSSFSSSSSAHSVNMQHEPDYDKLYFPPDNEKKLKEAISLTGSSGKEFFSSDDVRPLSEFSFRDMFRTTSDPKTRFSVLLGEKNSVYSSGESDSESLPAEKDTGIKRSGTVTRRSVSEVLTKRPRPLPDIPRKTASFASSLGKDSYWGRPRSQSERLSTNISVYQELERLQTRSVEVHDEIASRTSSQISSHSLGRHSFRPLPLIPTSDGNSRTSSLMHDLHLTISGTESDIRSIPSVLGFDTRPRNESVSSTSSSHSADLRRGGGIRRKKRTVAKHISMDSAWNTTESPHSSTGSIFSH